MTDRKDGSLWHVDAEIALEVGAHEALVRMMYVDSVGVKTWCVGMTDATGHLVGRYRDNPQPLEYCMAVYAWALDNYADAVRERFKGVEISKAQFAAALSFHWNTGAIKRATWVDHFRAGNISAARKAIMNWVTPKSLTGRRKKERALFFDGKWSNDGRILEYTRVTSSYSPDWSSGVKTDIRTALDAAFAKKPKPPVLDQEPKPDNKPAAPTLTPSDEDKPNDDRPEMGSDYLGSDPDQPSAGHGKAIAGAMFALIAAIATALGTDFLDPLMEMLK